MAGVEWYKNPTIMSNEIKYQKKIIDRLEDYGYFVIRLTKTNKNGLADILALKHCEVLFIEVKGKGGIIAPLQQYRADEVKKHNFGHVFTFEGDNFLTEIFPKK